MMSCSWGKGKSKERQGSKENRRRRGYQRKDKRKSKLLTDRKKRGKHLREKGENLTSAEEEREVEV